MIGRRVRVEGKVGTVEAWEPLAHAGCDARIVFDDGSVCWYASHALKPADELGPLPDRRTAQIVADETALRQLREEQAKLPELVHQRWPGMEFCKVIHARSLSGAIAEIEKRLKRLRGNR